MKKFVKNALTVGAVVLIGAGCSNAVDDNKVNQNVEKLEVKNTSVLGGEEKIVYLGDEKAQNEIVLLFDYSCPHCKSWMEETFPVLQEKLIDNGKAKFRTQSMVFLNETSLVLANFDQNVKEHYPELYFDVAVEVMHEAHNQSVENWGTEKYVEDKVEKFNLEKEKIIVDPSTDALSITRKYTKELEIESVPTIYVNGIKMKDAYDIEAITKAANK